MKLNIIENQSNDSAIVVCPECGETFYIRRYKVFKSSVDDDMIYHRECPHCSKNIFWDTSENVISDKEAFVCEHCGMAYNKNECVTKHQTVTNDSIELCKECVEEFRKYYRLVKNKNEMKNDHLFLDNHYSLKVCCPFCGDDISNNRFTQIGYGNSWSSGATCEKCKVDIFTYKVIKSRD